MTGKQALSNPFRGLRPFGAEEDHLFFGREKIVDQLLMRLRKTRFLSIIGSSGCGKSSLVQAGMIPSLYSGYMATAGSSWRVAVMRPGADPIANLASALTHPTILGQAKGLEDTSQVLAEATLLRSNSGLVECARHANLPKGENLLVIVDQFEELFRFRKTQNPSQVKEDAVAFVKRLIFAAKQSEFPIYIAITMRSDFIGECNDYPGLSEAINEGQFLVPRMTRTELRKAILGPIKVGGGEISPRLLVKLLNDVGDNPDRLPILQHALMRTWDYWEVENLTDKPLEIQHYDAIGGMDHALSTHVEEAYDELATVRAKEICKKIFVALTDTLTDNRGVRHPCSVAELCLITESGETELSSVIDIFRKPGRSFLMHSVDSALDASTIIDLSHESLMRVWNRLIQWTREENTSARIYRRVARAAVHFQNGNAGLWRDPELQIALNWRELNQPTPAWAARYAPEFSLSMTFIDKSKKERDNIIQEKRSIRKKRLQIAWGVAFVLLVFALYALMQQQRAEQEQKRAEQNFHLAVQAVDEMLADIAVENSLANIPQTEELRQQVLEKAQSFYESLKHDTAADPNLQLETAVAQVRLSKIYHLRGRPFKAADTLETAIAELIALKAQFPNRPQIDFRLGEAYDWYAVQIMAYDTAKAESAYEKAAHLHQTLINRFPSNTAFKHELARVYNNRAILLSGDISRTQEAEESFRKAVALFKGLTFERNDGNDQWRLSRTLNGLAGLLKHSGRAEESSSTYRQAIDIMGTLLKEEPSKREYQEGLARFYNNLANLHLLQGRFEQALQANTEARTLFEALAQAIPELRSEIANSYNTRGVILRELGHTGKASQALESAAKQFSELEKSSSNFSKDPNMNNRLGGILASLAILREDAGRHNDAIALIRRAIVYFTTAVNSSAPNSSYQQNLANAYWLLANFHISNDDLESALAAVKKTLMEGYSIEKIKINSEANGPFHPLRTYEEFLEIVEGGDEK